jgi:hypothetical protein
LRRLKASLREIEAAITEKDERRAEERRTWKLIFFLLFVDRVRREE